MKILMLILILLCIIRTFSFGKWCIKYDNKNIIGSIGVFLLVLGLLVAFILIYTGVKWLLIFKKTVEMSGKLMYNNCVKVK